jgi:dipeptidyl aminopeptidase/acylaminoacyl peptidase
LKRTISGFACGLMVTLAAALVSAGEHPATDRLTAMDVFNIQYGADPQISPDGSKIVYVRQFCDIMTDKRASNLWIVNRDGTQNRPLTTGSFSDTSPRWSPDATRLAYVSDRDGHPQLYVRWMDTGQTAKITDLEFPPSGIAWSPDGKLISFVALVAGSEPRLAELPKPPAGAHWADPPKLFDRLVYRFNGQGYLKPGFTQLFVVSADGGAPRQLTTGNFPHGTSALGGASTAWTPDGQYLIFPAKLEPDYEYTYHRQIYELRVADGQIKQLTHREGPNNSPQVSPDGQRIAYTGYDDRYQGHQTTYLYVMDRDGSHPRPLSASLNRDAENPEWAADGSGVYFLYDDQGDTKLGFASLDGKVTTLANHVGTGGSSYGGGHAFTVARDGTFAIPYTLPDEPGDIAVGRAGEAGIQIITALNRELLRQKKLGQVEEFWFNSSKDQRKIEGWLVKPPDFDPAKKYPLILEIHGGPFANYGDRFDIMKQIWAAMGYVVLYVNPRGSTSYGEEFANLIHHAYPGDDFYDLDAGVSAAVAKGYIDPENLFVTGGSGGGVLTCWMVERSTRFRAAASLYPVINWYSWTLTADIPIIGVKYWFPGPPWEYPQQYYERSVINHVQNVKTPTMLMTGEDDYRTPISEAEQFYEALRLRKVDTLLVRVPGEPHGISQRPSHLIAKTLYVAGWFEQHRARPARAGATAR